MCLDRETLENEVIFRTRRYRAVACYGFFMLVISPDKYFGIGNKPSSHAPPPSRGLRLERETIKNRVILYSKFRDLGHKITFQPMKLMRGAERLTGIIQAHKFKVLLEHWMTPYNDNSTVHRGPWSSTHSNSSNIHNRMF